MFSHLKHSLVSPLRRATSLGSQLCRSISSAEIATALRPFYFVVHPDLFGRHPKQRSVNEESLKHLSAHLEALQQQRPHASSTPAALSFYVRQTTGSDPTTLASTAQNTFKLIHISIDRRQSDSLAIIRRLLLSCDLSTEFVDAIRSASPSRPRYSELSPERRTTRPQRNHQRTRRADEDSGDRFYGHAYEDEQAEADEQDRIRKVKRERTLKLWLDANLEMAHTRSTAMDGIRADVANLEKSLVERLRLTGIHYDCGWNVEHYRGCLKSLDRLADQYEHALRPLQGRSVLFAPCSGVNLEGQVMLFTGDVHRSWLMFIADIGVQDDYLRRIPAYESALSHVLLGVQIARRKFMPKAAVRSYADHLNRVTTSMLDYLTVNEYPKEWPKSLAEFELVVESESGPLMVSPTGQFITPSTCSGSTLVDFFTQHMDEARANIEAYSKNKHIERDLHDRCIAELRLQALTKDDSIDPGKMIECMTRLLAVGVAIPLERTHLNITNYYSVLADGTVCIPWNWA